MRHKHTNLPETLWLPVCSFSSGGQTYKKKTCEIMQPFKVKKKNKNKHWATSWHLLDETEWRGEKGGGRSRASSVPGLGRGEEEAPHPSPSLPSPTCCRGRVWAWLTVMSIGHIWIFFSYSILTSPSSTHPLTHALHFSPMVLLFQLTKHLTWWKTVCCHMHTGLNAKKQTKNPKKKTRINVLWTLQEHF